mmetsp:Transcript_3610/g.7538  ORF Transcript_3610/g.7538 Transcript_3610/m.7538 type:complete len:290 (-) Transcript_3610:383-1252(-)
MPPSIDAVASNSSVKADSTSKQSTKEDVFESKLGDIMQALPDSTHAERIRFLKDRDGNVDAATTKLKGWLDWRAKYDLDSWSHLHTWEDAIKMAILAEMRDAGEEVGESTVTPEVPCPVFAHEFTVKEKNDKGEEVEVKKRYCHLLPARIDTKIASTAAYALALAFCLNHELDRETLDKHGIVIDVRGGEGWANISAFKLLPFIQSTVNLLSDLFPERLTQAVVFPMPGLATYLWKAVKPFCGKEAQKVVLVTGSAGIKDKVPKKLSTHLPQGLIKEFEERRLSCFDKK